MSSKENKDVIDKIKMELPADDKSSFSFDKKNKWVNNEFVLEDGEIVAKEIGSCTQYPLTLAWAITCLLYTSICSVC